MAIQFVYGRSKLRENCIMENNLYEEIEFSSADELWDSLSPTRLLLQSPKKFIYRGQASSSWELIPAILRETPKKPNPGTLMFGEKIKADDQIFVELSLLSNFVEFCDQIGLKIPNDSLYFRETALNPNNLVYYYANPSQWPNEDILELMAFAQHHGVPTRLLDWTRIPYIAAYFASSSAIMNLVNGEKHEKLAIWCLDITTISLYKNIKVINVPGSISTHIAAQSGLFTVHPHNGNRGGRFDITGLEHEFGCLPNTPLRKLTLSSCEAIRLHELCRASGFSGATIYPSADGAGKAVLDSLNLWSLEKNKG